jgi:hypothetical protein
MRLEGTLVYLVFLKKNTKILLKGAVMDALICGCSAILKPLSIEPPLVQG